MTHYPFCSQEKCNMYKYIYNIPSTLLWNPSFRSGRLFQAPECDESWTVSPSDPRQRHLNLHNYKQEKDTSHIWANFLFNENLPANDRLPLCIENQSWPRPLVCDWTVEHLWTSLRSELLCDAVCELKGDWRVKGGCFVFAKADRTLNDEYYSNRNHVGNKRGPKLLRGAKRTYWATLWTNEQGQLLNICWIWVHETCSVLLKLIKLLFFLLSFFIKRMILWISFFCI